MTIRESEYFVFDGIKSSDMGIINITTSSGMQDEPFSSNRTIIEQKVRNQDKPYFQELTEDPYEFDVTFYFEENWDDEKIRDVARWLLQDYYKELYFSDNLSRRFYAIVTDTPRLIHNMLKQGYIQLHFRCDAPYAYSPQLTEQYDFTSSGGGTVNFINNGDKLLLPEMHIQIGATGLTSNDISIVNNSNGGVEFKFTGLDASETIYIDNADDYIETDKSGVYRYDNFNGNYLKLIRGKNVLEVTGYCKIKFTYEAKLIQG